MNWLDLLNEEAEHGLSRNDPMYARITAAIRTAIQSGKLADNSRLPTNRELASLLKIDRSTVSRAYLELSQAGLIDSHVAAALMSARLRNVVPPLLCPLVRTRKKSIGGRNSLNQVEQRQN